MEDFKMAHEIVYTDSDGIKIYYGGMRDNEYVFSMFDHNVLRAFVYVGFDGIWLKDPEWSIIPEIDGSIEEISNDYKDFYYEMIHIYIVKVINNGTCIEF